jgi:hypothetical protein
VRLQAGFKAGVNPIFPIFPALMRIANLTYQSFSPYRQRRAEETSAQSAPVLRRTIHPEVRVMDSNSGLVEYIASDESIDSYNEVIKADGWRFDRFKKNAPFVDSHDYSSIEKQVGKVVDFRVRGSRLVETVQWAKDIPENRLAQIGWKMTEAGFLKAVSVGFVATASVGPNDSGYTSLLAEMGLTYDQKVRRIFTEQQQVELSAVIIPANPNAVAKAYKAELLTDSDLSEFFPAFRTGNNHMRHTASVWGLSQDEFLQRFESALGRI